MNTRYLLLEDGTVFKGNAFGSEEETIGEVIFTTAMTGYQESISDPSNCGQLLTFTYPMVGNYGVNPDDFESIDIALSGVIIRELALQPSNFRKQKTFSEFLAAKNVPGIEGIDTRKLTRIIRKHGSLKGKLTKAGKEVNIEQEIEKLIATNIPKNVVEQVSITRPYPSPGRGKRVVLVDFGMKHGILRELNKRDCDIIVVPYNTSAKEILGMSPDGVMLSNGPGDPTDIPEVIEMVKEIIGQVPIFGVCLGHQLISLASGATSFKLKFGHRGGNHPVKDLTTGRTELTSQNHGYAIDADSIANTDLEITHIALNDGTVEGVRHKKFPVFSVQFHPEGSCGPEDSTHLFDQFMETMNDVNKKESSHA
ncbi:carbamoyl phosphate synthase small subunit [Bacillus sp. FJAT-22090]|uniref:carbamoyl phosphate synthase small subunit n=1 Tax=Bacillus sp. FJAT-22090 TaxID=1581038 RepID=UPI00119F32BB|nr:carbamoyl phosphate synthase small subunit [Bacillus sp. FJAT-22090]